jgi:hypothetical protein
MSDATQAHRLAAVSWGKRLEENRLRQGLHGSAGGAL